MDLERVVTTPDNYEAFLLSQGIKFGNLLFISGQAGAGDDSRTAPGRLAFQTGVSHQTWFACAVWAVPMGTTTPTRK